MMPSLVLKINNNEDNGYDSGHPDMGPPDFDMPENNAYNPEDIPPCQDKGEDQDAHENLDDLCRSHLIAALRAVSNVVVEFMAHKSVFMQCGGLKQLVHRSKSIDSAIRVNVVWASKNLAFLVNNRCKEEILLELSTTTLTILICDCEASVQDHALALVCNLVDGTPNSIDYVFEEGDHILHAIGTWKAVTQQRKG